MAVLLSTSMDDLRIDIVLPVWNRPVETRNALVSLMACTAGARFILVDNGSDRETELMLHEFAEGLGEQALLIRTERNEGLVPAINRGLARSSAPFVAVVTTSTIVTGGWSEPLIAAMDKQPDTAAVLPVLAGKVQKGSRHVAQETTNLSFAAMVLRRQVITTVGLFNTELDGDRWCLREYAHRLHVDGWRMVETTTSSVEYSPQQPLGSESRRRALADAAREQVEGQWGDDGCFCLEASPASSVETLKDRMPVILAAARQGHRLTMLLPAKLHDALAAQQLLPLHAGISVMRLPRFLAHRSAASAVRSLQQASPGLCMVHLDDGAPVQGGISFESFAQLVAERAQRYFRR